MSNLWTLHESNPRIQKILCSQLGISDVLAQLLINRNIRTPEDAQFFLFGGMDACYDPFLMKDMGRAVERIKKAVASREKILLYGDYDVDGVTSLAVMSSILKQMHAEHETFIPNRLDEGYGLNVRAIALAREKGVKLIITLDCGINSFKEVACANDYGMDVIITDHHEIKKKDGIPPAYAIIDTHQEDCKYPYKGLAGVGVAYKLARALMAGAEHVADEYLDLVALGTIADVAPVNGENRILIKEGLRKLKLGQNPGLRALMDVARVRPENISPYHVGFILGPRINAVGRVGSANFALELLLSKDKTRVTELAEMLDAENRNRQTIEKNLLSEAVEMFENSGKHKDGSVIVLAKEAWHPGVLGIAASRLSEQYDKPAILISLDGDKGKGSGRGIDGFNLFEALLESSGYLIDFGGHESACGLKVKKDNVDAFRDAMNVVAAKKGTERGIVRPELMIDTVLPFSQVGLKLVEDLKMLMPYGSENPEPIFSSNAIKVKNSPKDLKGNGFKFFAACGNVTCEAVSFRRNKVSKPKQGNVINLAYTPGINSWGGIETIQLNVKDIQVLE